jgi:hypothetical protein
MLSLPLLLVLDKFCPWSGRSECRCKLLRLYLQHFIFFVNYEWTQKVRAFVTSKPSQPIVIYQSGLLGSFIS